MRPKATKSVAMTTIVIIQATAATSDAKSAPMTPEPRARRKAMNARANATGCKIMTRVSASDVFSDAVLKSVLSISAMICAGLYPTILGEQ